MIFKIFLPWCSVLEPIAAEFGRLEKAKTILVTLSVGSCSSLKTGIKLDLHFQEDDLSRRCFRIDLSVLPSIFQVNCGGFAHIEQRTVVFVFNSRCDWVL